MIIIIMGTIVLITAAKGFVIWTSLKPITSAPRNCPFRQLGVRYVCSCYARRYFPASICNNLLLVKTSADYIITKLTKSTHVNFSQLEHFVCRDLIFMLSETLQFYVQWSYVNWESKNFWTVFTFPLEELVTRFLSQFHQHSDVHLKDNSNESDDPWNFYSSLRP